jgi:AraC-like DNA-binding protein
MAHRSITPQNATAVVKLAKALQFVESRYHDPDLNLPATAAAVGLSASYLSRLLVQRTGSGFVHYVRELRLRAATMLLVSTTKSVKEIAGDVGYTRVNELCRNFKSVHGMTPLQFRLAAMTKNDDSTQAFMTHISGQASERGDINTYAVRSNADGTPKSDEAIPGDA